MGERTAARRPYFGPDIVGLQSPPIRHAYMRAVVLHLVQTSERRPLNILEIGSWAGASAITWAQALKTLAPAGGKLMCVDIWRPYLDSNANPEHKLEAMSQAAKDGVIFKVFLDNLCAAGVEDFVEYRVGSSRDVLPGFPDASFDIVYIDGSHAYPDVSFDVHQALRLVNAQGVVCGDDLELQLSDVDADGNRAAAHAGKDTLVDPKTGLHYHPGVTLAVMEAFGTVSEWQGFWAVQRDGAAWRRLDLAQYPLAIPEHLQDLPRFAESYGGFNLFERSHRCCAVRQSLGAVNVAAPEGELADRYAARDVFFTDSVETARLRIELMELRELLRPFSQPGAAVNPELIGEYHGFNLVRLGAHYCAVRQALGEVNLRMPLEGLAARHDAKDLALAGSYLDAKARVDAIELHAVVREHAARLHSLEVAVSGLERAIREQQDRLLAIEQARSRAEQKLAFRILRKLRVL